MKKLIVPILVIGLLLNMAPLSMGGEEVASGEQPLNWGNPVEYWAILVSMGDQNFDYYAHPLKDILVESGWQEDHIKVLAQKDVTFGNVDNALLWLRKKSDSNDRVLFWHVGHGHDEGFEVYRDEGGSYCIFPYGRLKLFFWLTSCDGLAVVLNGCYSGGAIPKLEKNGRVILTASDRQKMADSWFSQIGFYSLPGFADFEGNNDNWVSAEEIFDFINQDYNISRYNPQISDKYAGDLGLIKFNYLNWPGLLDKYVVHGLFNYQKLYATAWKAQSFIPSYPILSGVMIYIHISNGNPGPLILSIRKDLDGDDLYNYSMTVEQERFHFKIGKAYTFELPDIEVTPGEKYWIVLKSNGDSGANSYAIPRAKDHYPDGELAYSADGHTWNNYSNSDDMYFSILGRPVDDPPVKPDKPSLSGISRLKYTFSTSTTDPDGDQIYYKWDWGDDICSDWLGPYDSGETVEASHTFKKEDIYSVRVKASDPYCAKSDWSDPLSVNMPNQNSQSSQSSSQQSLSPPFPLQILEQRTGCFPLLERLPSRIVN